MSQSFIISPNLYPLKKVQHCAEDFTHLAEISFQELDIDSYEMLIVSENPEIVFFELMNYVLSF